MLKYLKIVFFYILLSKSSFSLGDDIFGCPDGFSGNKCDECAFLNELNSDSYPTLAYITYNYNGNFKRDGVDTVVHKAVKCGGALIDRDKILTVAHCIVSAFDFTYQNKNYTINVNPTDFSNHHVQLGFKARSNKIKYGTQMVRIKDIILHENYNAVTRQNDIALLILKKNVTLDPFTKIACLPNKQAYPNLDNQVYAFNWNDLFMLSTQTDLKLSLLNDSDCSSYDSFCNNSQICAGNLSTSSTNLIDENGSPLYYKIMVGDKTRYVLAGFITHNLNALANVFTKIDFHLDWIQQSILESSGICPTGWLISPFKQCYYKSATQANWTNAESDCKSKNAHIITINTQAEFDYFNSIRAQDHDSWLGLIAYAARKFIWIDGTTSFISWEEDEPNNNGGLENYLRENRAHMDITNGNLFNDCPESNSYYYVCELNVCNSTQYFDSDLAKCTNRKTIDEPCNDTAFECNSNLVCVGTTGSKTCSYDIN